MLLRDSNFFFLETPGIDQKVNSEFCPFMYKFSYSEIGIRCDMSSRMNTSHMFNYNVNWKFHYSTPIPTVLPLYDFTTSAKSPQSCWESKNVWILD